MKKIVLAMVALFLTACSVDKIKPRVVETVKTTIVVKKDITVSLLPNEDTSITIDGQTHTIKRETYDSVKSLLETNAQLQMGLVDLIGSQATDENVATIAYYVDKYKLPAKELLTKITEKPHD